MVGIMSGAIGENALAEPLTTFIGTFSVLQPYAQPIALSVVVITLTYFSVVVGELVPKHLGLLNPERIARVVSRPMRLIARVTKPIIWLFSASANMLLKLFSGNKINQLSITNEEINILMEQGAEAGVFHESEQMLVSNVLRLDEQLVVAIMTRRQDIRFLDITKPDSEVREYLATCPYSRIIVCRGGWNDIVGLLRTADLLQAALTGKPLDIEGHLRQPLYIPEYATTTQLLESFRKAQLQCALVVDEFGDIQGLVTLTDVLTAIVGELPSSSTEGKEFTSREDGSWLIEGGASIERVKLTLGIKNDLPGEKSNTFHSLGGFIIHVLGRIPEENDQVEEQEYRFEVIDMDQNRIDKILASRISYEEE